VVVVESVYMGLVTAETPEVHSMLVLVGLMEIVQVVYIPMGEHMAVEVPADSGITPEIGKILARVEVVLYV
jgi:hypothetical protein